MIEFWKFILSIRILMIMKLVNRIDKLSIDILWLIIEKLEIYTESKNSLDWILKILNLTWNSIYDKIRQRNIQLQLIELSLFRFLCGFVIKLNLMALRLRSRVVCRWSLDNVLWNWKFLWPLRHRLVLRLLNSAHLMALVATV